MDAITEHHYLNIARGKAKPLEDGTLATVNTIIVNIDGVETLIPTVWDGEIVSDEEATRFAINSGVDWPTRTGENAVQELEEFDAEIHKSMTDMTSPEEASEILQNNKKGFDEGGLMVETSPRPKSRPKTTLTYEDADKIERLVWAEARGEGVEGRNAVRGVILNRLASSRFPNDIDGVLDPKEFEPLDDHGDVYSIPIPEEDLQRGHNEFADYYQLGKDAVDGRTFFQNTKTTKARGTNFSGPDPITIGNHTFTRGYEGQEPVYDTNFSHNITVIYPEYAEATLEGMALGGLAVARKGIMTPEGKDMADKKFQLDENKADLDDDGSLSSYEKTRAEAVQKAVDDPDQDEKYSMYHGGMMEPVDPVSGNPIPPGSTAENVRDDIDVNLSEGEYVLPADVVRWHGLKHIMDMQDEAKSGLMMMDSMGLLVGDTPVYEECSQCSGEGCENCEGEASEEDETETPEGNEIELPTVETVESDIIEGDETEELAEDEMYGKEDSMPSMFGMVKKPKISFII
jgi:spore germination cell wall hydrolase CwlJ-like protein